MEFLRDPSVAGTAQSIGAFASLHVSIFFTAALATHLLGLGRYVKIAVWVLFALTVAATVYFGWHYVLDDLAGLVIAVTALTLARVLVGIDLRALRKQPAREPGLMASRTLLEPGREARRRREPARPVAGPAPAPRRRMVLAGPIVAGFLVIVGLFATDAADVPLRDPDHVAALYLVLVGFGVFLLVGLDIAVRAARRGHAAPVARGDGRGAARALDTGAGGRRGHRAGELLRQLHGVPQPEGDRAAAAPGRHLRPPAGRPRPQPVPRPRSRRPPAHLLGVGIPTHILSTGYAAFIVFLPLSLAVALVFSRDIRAGLFYATALSANWVLGAASYFLLPSLGPVYYEPQAFAHLPHSEVTRLQDMLLDQRVEFLVHPATATPQSIAAFASLHISMSLTAVLAAHLLGLGKRLKIALWVWLGLTTLATVYLGWHYFLDDLGGIVIAVGALGVARLLTGIDLRAARGQAAVGAARG